jgi:CubicO group peptidase (beta-lactamase class C family)
VRAAFEDNFRVRGEVGAAFAVYLEDRLVVDLWGGRAGDRPWTPETLQLVFSGGKALVATAVLMLVQRGALDLDAPVRSHWPEFAAGEVRVRHLLDHTAGLPGVRTPIGYDDVLDGRRPAALLAEQAPWWPPGRRLSYHALTFGWLLGELVRRVDGRSVGRFVRDEIAAPLGIDAWIGLPPEHAQRVARTIRRTDAPPEAMRGTMAEGEGAWCVWANPPLFYGPRLVWNDPRFHAAEIPGANAIATARGMARFYAALLAGELLEPGLLRAATAEHARGRDPFSDLPFRFGLGFQLQTELGQFGPPATAFGHGGAGGSAHGAWPEQRIAFSYVMNELRSDPRDARPLALLDALAASVAART